METIIGYAVDPQTIKDTFGEYRIRPMVSPNMFYSMSGDLIDGGMQVKYSDKLYWMNNIYWKAIKAKGVGYYRAIAIALSYTSEEDFLSNPYLCAIKGIVPFKVADAVGKILGFDDDNPKRLSAMAVCELLQSGSTIWHKTAIEEAVGKELTATSLEEMSFVRVDEDGNYVLEAIQEAVDVILSKLGNIEIVTGMAGTGKTTQLVNMYNDVEGYVVAFTAKAAKRVNEVMGKTVASTIHRLISTQERLTASVVYIDEASMVNTLLLADLMSSVESSRYVMIGDGNQLPAIGGGSPFVDLIANGNGNINLLEKIYRTDSPGILNNAKRVLDGQMPSVESDEYHVGATTDIDKVIAHDPHALYLTFTNAARGKINTKIRKVVNPNKPMKYRYKSFAVNDKVVHLKNNYQHGIFNSDMGTVEYVDKYCMSVQYDNGVVLWYMDNSLNVKVCTDSETEGRKVGVCGAGTLYKAGWKHFLVPSYEEIEVTMTNVDLAYCLTVHKSQGSEADDIVICAEFNQYLSRQWLYTAITRAKKSCIILMDAMTMRHSSSNLDTRKTYFSYRLNNKE